MIKKLIKFSIRGVIVCLLLIISLFAIVQTEWAKDILQKKVFEEVQKQGYTLSIRSIEGDLPFTWNLQDVLLTFNETDSLKIDTLTVRFSIFSLLRKQIIVNYLYAKTAHLSYQKKETNITVPQFLPWTVVVNSAKVDHLVLKETDYALQAKGYVKKHGKSFSLDTTIQSSEGSGNFHLEGHQQAGTLSGLIAAEIHHLKLPQLKDQDVSGNCDLSFSISSNHIDIEQLSLKSNLLCLKGDGRLSPSLTPKNGSFSFLFPHLSLLSPSIAGILTGNISYTPDALSANFESEELKIASTSYQSSKGELKAFLKNNTWDGSFSLDVPHSVVPLELRTFFSFSPKKIFTVKDFSFKVAETQIAGDGSLSYQTDTVEGAFFTRSCDLSPLALFFPDSELKGSLAGMLSFKDKSASFYGLSQNLQCYDLFSSQISLKGSAFDLFNTPKATISLEGETTYVKQFLFNHFLFSAHLDKRWAFDFSCQGDWKDPFDCISSGSFSMSESMFDIEFDVLKGSILTKSFFLQKPFSIQRTDKAFVVSECDVKLKKGYFLASMDLNSTMSKIRVKAEHFPIDLLALSTSRCTLTGNSSLDIVLDGSKDNLQGRAGILLEKADILQSGKKVPIHSKGSLQINLDQNIVQIHGNFKASGQQFCEITLAAPLVYNFYPLKFGIDKKKPLFAEVTMEGHLEEIFDFINIGSHSTAGLLSCHLLVSHNLADPLFQGTLEIQNGSYENYFTGMVLKGIDIEGRAEGPDIKLTSIKASDQEKGSLTGAGKVTFAPFSFLLDFNIEDLKVLHLNWLSGLFSGPVTLSGNAEKTLAQGDLTISKADIEIPDDLPVDLPVLPFTYINKPPHISKINLSPKENYPFHYDLILHAPKNILLTGRGLNAELEGNLVLKGKNLSLEGEGSLNIIKGTFSFSGKEFTLTQGALSFVNTPSPHAYLNLSGTLSLPDMTVIALLRGPLNSPVLTLQSTPTMPTSSILARILFNKDISELTALQAAQLAYSIVSLSGNSGPNVFELIRKSLGVDRLNISSSPSKSSSSKNLDQSKNSDQFTVQIGKYLTKGVMITLSQSTETSQVIVEVELKNGFVLQAETQDNEQGKFSLKWNKNY